MKEYICTWLAENSGQSAKPLFCGSYAYRLALWLVVLFGLVTGAKAGPLFDTSTPINFFTNVAGRLLSSEMNVNLAHIEVYPTNQYTPAVHRLLQVTANIWDAQNTNFYPTVFRPLFAADASNDIFIVGYQQVAGMSGPSDPQLASPYDPATLLNSASNTVPIMDGNGPVNIYGVPWVLGAKQGLPNFNQLSCVSALQVVRKLEVSRTSENPLIAMYATNQMYMMGLSNALGVTFWNSYSNNYPRPLTVYVSDFLSTTLTNAYYTWSVTTNFRSIASINSWPGSQWSGTPPNSAPSLSSFFQTNCANIVQSLLPYDPVNHVFTIMPPSQWPSLFPQDAQLDQFGMVITNYLQAYILDGNNVVDYVQFRDPITAGNLNQALADPNYPDLFHPGLFDQWSTNGPNYAPWLPYGIINQLYVSGHNLNTPPTAQTGWATTPTPMGISTPAAEAAYFNGFFTPTFQFGTGTYANHQLIIQAPYTASRTVYFSSLLQANDPLVHYLASDLNAQPGALSIWANTIVQTNGIGCHSDDPSEEPLPTPAISPLGGRYQPWGCRGQMRFVAGTDTNYWNLSYRDPVAWGSDYWNFPTGENWSLSWLGQVHRGTPWQTIYLKSTNILNYITPIGYQFYQGAGTNTWAAWTGDLLPDAQTGQYLDAAASAPCSDWQLVSLLAAMLNTNYLSTQFSVNNPDPNAWANLLNGMIALTNLPPVFQGGQIVPQLSSIVISANSSQASNIISAIQVARAALPNQNFQNIGQMLSVPALSVHSPYLNVTNPIGFEYGLNDQACEAIPSQLLSLLRMDSIGQFVSTNGQTQVQFSGYDGHQYAVQLSPDLVRWTNVSTNSPTNGVFYVAMPGTPGVSQFYRTVLVQ